MNLNVFILIPGTCVMYSEYHCPSWTGGNDVEMEGIYRWQHSNVNMNFTNWRKHEPSTIFKGREEDCVQMMTNGYWNDAYCNEIAAFICEI
jgi:hypothetical protein